MDTHNPFWQKWARTLQRWGMQGAAAAILESLEPLHPILAQLVYAGGSLFGSPSTGGQWTAIGELLENREKSRSFASFLREETSSDT